MNKKLFTGLFLVVGVVFNIVLIVVFLVLLVFAARLLIKDNSASVWQVIMILSMVGSIALDMLVYNKLLRFLAKRIDFDSRFYPIFSKFKVPGAGQKK